LGRILPAIFGAAEAPQAHRATAAGVDRPGFMLAQVAGCCESLRAAAVRAGVGLLRQPDRG